MLQVQKLLANGKKKSLSGKPTISLGAFKGLSFAFLFFFVLGVGSVEILNIKSIEKMAQGIREQRLPLFIENNKTLVNIESLRGLANVAHVSDDQLVRKKARVNAFALSAESQFDSDGTFRDATRNVALKVKQMVERRDIVERLENDLDILGQQYLEYVEKLLKFGNTELYDKIMQSLYYNNPIILGSNGLKKFEKIENRDAFLLEQKNIFAALVKQISVNNVENSEELQQYLSEATEVIKQYENIVTQILLEQVNVNRLAEIIDIDLRTMRDKVTVGAEFAISNDLESIASLARKTYLQSTFIYAGLFVAFLIFFFILYIFITKPLRWTSNKLATLQEGYTDLEAPRIYITEIAYIANLLDRFSVHLAELYSHANQLEEDVAEKKDIEELMQAVFKASLDGYLVWDLGGIKSISQGLPALLGFVSAEEMLENWRIFDHSQKSLGIIFDSVKEKESLREELNISNAFGRTLPVEITHLPVTFRGNLCVLSYIRDLTQQKMHEEALLFAKEQAEVATKAKGDFLARMSHEIRTPMNGVLGLTHIALASDPPAKQRELLGKIQSSAKVLLGVINDILDFSKIEEGKLDLEKNPFYIPEVFTTIQDLLEAQANKKQIELVFDYDKSALNACQVIGDSLRMTQILLNLCGNGIKFTDSGQVALRAKVLSETESRLEVRFGVQDTGIGLTEEQMSKVFQPFVQVDTSSTRKYGGTGLGLMIAKLLVELMGGNLEVQSSLGSGSEFFFSVNFDKAAPCLPAEVVLPLQEVDSELAGKKVLVAEDNEINQEIIQSLLEDFSLHVTLANNGQEAVDMANREEFDIILLDIQMPVMDGLTAAKCMRESGKVSLKNIPIIAMTAHAMQEDVDKSLAVGMNAHLTKPIDVAALRTCLSKFIVQRKLQ